MVYTYRELSCLLKLRKKPRTWEYLKGVAKTDEAGMNIMLSRLGDLYYFVDDAPIKTGEIKLNQKGETVAQAEFDRRFDMYFTRAISLAGLLVSIAAIAIAAL